VYRLEYDPCTELRRQFRGTVIGVIVYDDELVVVAELNRWDEGLLNTRKGACDKPFFVVGGDDNREFHAVR